jgi:hypothetical protein
MHAVHTLKLFFANGASFTMDNDEDRRPTNAILAAATPGTHNSIPVSELYMAMDLTSRAPATLVDVWDDKCDERRGEKGGKTEQQYCKWCDTEFKQWNATKCLARISRTMGRDI